MKMIQLDDRSKSVLSCIIEHYIANAEPLGSRVLSKSLENQISAATIRNVMSDLSDLGLIEQPHTSAGRIPTDLGYRYYVDHLSPKKAHRINKATPLKPKGAQALEEILADAAAELTNITHFAGFVLTPNPALSRLKKLEFIQVSLTQILVVLVTQSGMVKSRILHFRECPSQEVLDKAAKVMNEHYQGQTLTSIQENLIPSQESMPELSAQAIRLGVRAFEIAEEGEVLLSGESNLCGFPEFNDHNQLRQVFELLEDRHALFGALNTIERPEGLKILIGGENQSPNLAHCSVLSASYTFQNSQLGSIGVIGPTRMDYPKVIEALKYSSQRLSQVVSNFINEQ